MRDCIVIDQCRFCQRRFFESGLKAPGRAFLRDIFAWTLMRAPSLRFRLLIAALLATAMSVECGRAQTPSGGVPVTVTTVGRADRPILLHALGTVQPFQTVTVRARVDGAIDTILFTEGQTVKRGELLAQLDPRPYQAVFDQAIARKGADEANLANARSDMVRYTELATAQIASRQKFDQAKAAVGQAEAVVRGDDASIAAAQLNLNFTQIAAPIAGRVGLRLVDPGNVVRAADTASSAIVTITQIHPISVLFTLPQTVLGQVQSAMRERTLPVTVSGPDNKANQASGELMTIDSAIDQSTGTIKLKAVFSNLDESLWPGQFVDVALQTGTLANVPVVPSAVVQRGQDGFYVYVVHPDQTAARQAVTVTQDDGTIAVLASGLSGGETVVTGGQSRLTDGTRVVATAARPAS